MGSRASGVEVRQEFFWRADGQDQASTIGRQVAGRAPVCVWDDFEQAHDRMVAGGVEFAPTAPRTEPYGKVAVFLDVTGNRWDLIGPS